MGSFGLHFSKKLDRPEGGQQDITSVSGNFVYHDEEEDGTLQKTLAYSSYYTLVFVTACAFMPSTVASAAESLVSLVR